MGIAGDMAGDMAELGPAAAGVSSAANEPGAGRKVRKTVSLSYLSADNPRTGRGLSTDIQSPPVVRSRY